MPEDPDPAEEMGEVPPEKIGEDGVLAPDDLTVDDREEVKAIGDGRYVVSTEEGTEPTPRNRLPTDVDESPAPEETPTMEDAVSAVSAQYATALAVKTDRGVADEQFESNNIVDTFEQMLRWYATRIDASESPEDVLRVLLAKSDLDL